MFELLTGLVRTKILGINFFVEEKIMKKILVLLLLCTIAATATAVTQDDMVLFRTNAPFAGNWYAHYSGGGAAGGFNAGGGAAGVDTTTGPYGFATAKPMMGDVNGDGLDDIVVAQDASGAIQWAAGHTVNDGAGNGLLSTVATSGTWPFGTTAGNLGNFLADINGDGYEDAVTINSGFNWHMLPSGAGGIGTGGAASGPLQFGLAGDQPIIGDFDGDGYDDVGVYQVNYGGAIVWSSSAGGVFNGGGVGPTGQIGGSAGDQLIVANLNGDAYDDVVMVRDNGIGGLKFFGLINDGTGHLDFFNPGTTIVDFGFNTDIPMVADISGDGLDDLVVYRDGWWYAAYTGAGGVLTNGVNSQASFGSTSVFGDVPLFGSLQIPEPTTVILLSLGGLLLRRKK